VLPRELLLALDRVTADPHRTRPHGGELGGQIAEMARLGGAAGGERRRIEEQHDGPFAHQLGEAPGRAGLVGQREVLDGVADLYLVLHGSIP
jgi:hypothetical protein